MRKILLFLLIPSVCFGAGTVSIKQGSTGGGTITIEGATGGGGGGTITGVTAGNGLTGGGVAGNVTLAVDPSTVTLQGVFLAGSNITLTPSAGFTTIDASGGLSFISTMTAGATNFIFNQSNRQSGAGLNVDSVTANYLISQPSPSSIGPDTFQQQWDTKDIFNFWGPFEPVPANNLFWQLGNFTGHSDTLSIGVSTDTYSAIRSRQSAGSGVDSTLTGIVMYPGTITFYTNGTNGFGALSTNGFSTFKIDASTAVISKSLTLSNRSSGVAHVNSSSQVVTGLVSLSTEVTGLLPAASIDAGSLGASVLASSFPVTGVTAGSYTAANITVNAQGMLTAASNGSGVSGSSNTVGVTVYNGGVAISTTQSYARNYAYIPYACTISSWTIMQSSGSITYDVKISSQGAFPTTVSMVGAGTKPSVTTNYFATSAPSSWTQTTIPAGSELEFTVEQATAVTKSTLALTVVRQ